MELTKGVRIVDGRVRTVHPLADPDLIPQAFLDPDFYVEVIEEANVVTGRRWDRFKWDPTNKKDPRYSEKLMKVSAAEVSDLVKGWGNLFEKGQPVECTDDNKILLVEVVIPTLDEEQKWKSLWRLTQMALEKQREAEAGN